MVVQRKRSYQISILLMQNAHSSRSHAIVIVTVEKKLVGALNARSSVDRRQTQKGFGLPEK